MRSRAAWTIFSCGEDKEPCSGLNSVGRSVYRPPQPVRITRERTSEQNDPHFMWLSLTSFFDPVKEIGAWFCWKACVIFPPFLRVFWRYYAHFLSLRPMLDLYQCKKIFDGAWAYLGGDRYYHESPLRGSIGEPD